MKFVKTKTSDGVHFVGLLSEPKKKTDKIIIHIHGMAGSPYENSWYQTFHDLYPKNGYSFLAGQHRGTGSITIFLKDPHTYPSYGDSFEIFEDSVLDIDAWVNYARRLGYKKIYLQAHSFGPSKVIYYLNKKPTKDIVGLNLISPVDMLGSTLKNSNHKSMLAEAKSLFKSRRKRHLLSGLLNGEMYISAQTYLNLFTPKSKSNIFCYTNRKHDWSQINKIKIPTLLIGGTKDGVIEAISKTEVAFKILIAQFKNSPKVVSKIYKGAYHSFDGYEKEIVKDFVSFLKT